MEHTLPIPPFQPIGFPAPVWLMKIVLLVGFFSHAIPMNIAFMGGIVGSLFLLAGQWKNIGYATRLGNILALSLPFAVSWAITMGIVPLLFLQVVYGPMFYSSSIIMAAPWLGVILLLLIGYYGYYFYGYRRNQLASRGPWILMLFSLFFLVIAFFFTNNMTLMLTPHKWVSIYESDPLGRNLNWGEPQILPRYLHFLVAATAVTGLLIGSYGIYWARRDEDFSRWLLRQGAGLYIVPTLIQIPVGLWFLFSLPQEVTYQFLGEDPAGTGVFIASLVLDVISLILMGLVLKTANPKLFAWGTGLVMVVIFLMIIMRHLVREYLVSPYLNLESVPDASQWELITLFLIAASITVLYIAWLVRQVWQAFHRTPEDTPITAVSN